MNIQPNNPANLINLVKISVLTKTPQKTLPPSQNLRKKCFKITKNIFLLRYFTRKAFINNTLKEKKYFFQKSDFCKRKTVSLHFGIIKKHEKTIFIDMFVLWIVEILPPILLSELRFFLRRFYQLAMLYRKLFGWQLFCLSVCMCYHSY